MATRGCLAPSLPICGRALAVKAAMKASRSQRMDWVLPWTSQSMARRRGSSMHRGVRGAKNLHTADRREGEMGGWMDWLAGSVAVCRSSCNLPVVT